MGGAKDRFPGRQMLVESRQAQPDPVHCNGAHGSAAAGPTEVHPGQWTASTQHETRKNSGTAGVVKYPVDLNLID